MFGKVGPWVAQHPIPSVAIGAGGLIVVLWIFGAFSRKPATSDGGASNMAAAYYAAEAQQAVVGGQIQMANIQATRDTAIAGLATDAAVKSENIRATAATTINQQNVGGSIQLSADQLSATRVNAATALATVQTNTAAQQAIEAGHDKTSVLQSFINMILPAEFAQHPGGGFLASIPGYSDIFSTTGSLSPAQMREAGYSEAAIAASGG